MEYKIYTDGASRGNPGKAGAGGIILDSSGVLVGSISEYLGVQTNNYAEYKALELTLELAIRNNMKKISVFMDSRLVVEQLNNNWKVKNENLLIIYSRILLLLKNFESVTIKHIYRIHNQEADLLANKAIDNTNTT